MELLVGIVIEFLMVDSERRLLFSRWTLKEIQNKFRRSCWPVTFFPT
ncbi:hypothetical protein LINPERPRIM_LOCUS16970 [Linum perenne]